VEPHELKRALEAARAYPDQIERTMALAEHVRGSGDCVQRILIHLDKRSPTARFKHFGQRLVPIYNYLQAALVMYQDELIDCGQLLFVIDEMLASSEFEVDSLANSMQDLLRRGRFAEETAQALGADLATAAEGASSPERAESIEKLADAFAERVADLGEGACLDWPDENPQLDYVDLIDAEHGRKRSDQR
jgi:hypothetical protein